MTDELTLKILAEIAAPGSGHLFSRREAARHAITLIEQQAARIAELEAAEKPYAYELHLPNDEYSLVYAAYLAKYATDEERACERLALYAAPVHDSAMAKLFERLMMCGVIDIGEAYLELNVVGYPPTLEEFIAASEPKKGEQDE